MKANGGMEAPIYLSTIPTFVARMNQNFQSDSVALMFANYFHIAHPLENVVSHLCGCGLGGVAGECLDAFSDLREPKAALQAAE